jgi:hypothetical protein
LKSGGPWRLPADADRHPQIVPDQGAAFPSNDGYPILRSERGSVLEGPPLGGSTLMHTWIVALAEVGED